MPGVHVNNCDACRGVGVRSQDRLRIERALPPLSIVKVFMPDLTGPFVLDRCAEVRLGCLALASKEAPEDSYTVLSNI